MNNSHIYELQEINHCHLHDFPYHQTPYEGSDSEEHSETTTNDISNEGYSYYNPHTHTMCPVANNQRYHDYMDDINNNGDRDASSGIHVVPCHSGYTPPNEIDSVIVHSESVLVYPENAALPQSQVRHELVAIREIFPDETDTVLIECLEANNWNLDAAVLKLLDQQQSSTVALQPQEGTEIRHDMSQASANSGASRPGHLKRHLKNYRPQELSRTNSPQRRHNSRRVASFTTLPDDFISVPRVRTVIHSPFPLRKANSIDFTVHFNRTGASLDLNVKTQGGNIVVNALHTSSSGGPGLSQQAGVQIGDVLYGINFEYFNAGVTLSDVTKVVAAAGPFLCLHFIRFMDTSTIPCTDGSTPQHVVSLRKIHPCALMLLDQEVLEVDDMESFCESLSRLKARTMDWCTGTITERRRIRDLAVAMQYEGFGTTNGTGTRDDSMIWLGSHSSRSSTDSSEKIRKKRWSVTTGSSTPAPSPVNPCIGDACDVRQNWYKEVTMSTRDIQPAISIRITGTKVIEDHTEYVIWVQDVATGLQWYTRRRFREFYRLRETLISLWGAFESLPFPARRLSVGRTDPSGSLVSERRPVLETFLRSAYQILVSENLVHPATRKLFLLIYHFVDVPYYMPSISALYAQQKKLHDAHISRLLEDHTYVGTSHCDDEDDTLDLVNDPFIHVRRWAEVYIHSVLQLPVFRKIVGRFVRNYIRNSRLDSSKPWSEDEAVENVKSLGEFIDNLQDVLSTGMRADIAEVIEHFVHGNTRGRYVDQPRQIQEVDIEDDMPYVNAILKLDRVNSIARVAVRRQIETEVYVPCVNAARAVLAEGFARRDSQLAAKCRYLKHQPQSFFGIPLNHISPSSWEEVIHAFDRIPNMTIPFDKLQLLVAAAKQIPECYREEHPDASRSLGADDMLPIFIYCLAMSNISQLSVLSKELENVCDSECRVSEIGYYTATLEASLQHILDMNEVDGDFN
mmetsp:Transcript_10712/g.16233  ORF Transcript_10712/g.16233 Transcript_10712/m.16233 type:complete len:967 (-) Transcript_10712:128-3028(-)|eukprot:CAMPEP_0185022986 /NCGR_PEP_ID=MMETSP1103-20130426/5695_1 /TAXON_ID=36769 /ORGANISM="Paraphysomonas bandaiensis, Strain Caron Lab Isolate" /LENGTH=966 /DNA_ID=CAMNT_0027555353 /DNA_START=84 /DNA_END=2984 /DNA_ORIENTATION=+